MDLVFLDIKNANSITGNCGKYLKGMMLSETYTQIRQLYHMCARQVKNHRICLYEMLKMEAFIISYLF